jgi:hypothetical protein
VVLEPCDFAKWSGEHDIADAALDGGAGVARLHIEDADPGDRASILIHIAAPEELKPAAYGEHWHSIRCGGAESFSSRLEVFSDATLLAVLAAADDHDVERCGVERVSEPDINHFDGDSARLATVLERDGVAAVAIDVHDIGVKVRDAKGQGVRRG